MRFTFTYFTDPGHGWLRVSRAHLEALHLEHAITPYSYARGKWVYLEEDCDAPAFIAAARATGWIFTIKHRNSAHNYSTIRTYYNYSPERAAA
jgi:hypothetical protein